MNMAPPLAATSAQFARIPEESEVSELKQSSVRHRDAAVLPQNSNSPDRQDLTALERLQRARQAHEALQRADRRRVRDNQTSMNTIPEAPTALPVAELAAKLSEMYRSEQSSQGESDLGSGNLGASLAKIGEVEKDGLILHLLQQCSTLRRQRDDATALGESIATQLVQQQVRLFAVFMISATR